MSKRKKSWLMFSSMVIVLAVLAGTFGMMNYRHAGEAAGAPTQPGEATRPTTKSERPAVSVTVAPVTLRPIQRSVEVVGAFSGQEEVLVTPQVDGRVVKIHHDMGDVVHVGEVLLEIDPTDYRLAAEEARKEYESKLAKVGLTDLTLSNFDVNQLPSVARARNVEQNAARKLARAQQLYQRKIVPQEELDQNETDYRVAAATLRQVIMDAQAIVAEARFKYATLLTAEQRLKDTRVLVPAPAMLAGGEQGKVEYSVSQRMISEGEMARRTSLTGVFRLVIDQTLKFLAAVPERYVGQVKIGQTVQLQVEAYPDRPFEGVVTRVSPTVDRTSRTFQIEAAVPNQSRELKAGGFAKAAILTRVDPQAKTVPVEAVVTMVGVTKVFVADKGKAHAVIVTPGVSGRGWVEILGDLQLGSQVITSGQNNLAEGTPVLVHKPDENARTITSRELR
jgi:RND family efflux transporter MFP subunit